MIDADVLTDLHRTFGAALSHEDPEVARRALLEAGWLESLDADEAAASAIVFRLQGVTRTDAAVLDDVMARHLAARWREISGDVAVAYPVAAGAGQPTSHVVLFAHRTAGHLLWMEDLSGENMEILALDKELGGVVGGGVDPDFRLLKLSHRPSGRAWALGQAGTGTGWDEALAAGRVALSHQLIAGAHATMTAALEYARARRQFGTPIGSFQAVKHRLADTLVAISAADSAALAAATTGGEASAAIAKALAGRAAATAARNCLQVFGGVGFTVEHDFHRYYRRSLVLDRLLGDPRSIEQELGRRLRGGEIGPDRFVNLDDDPRLALHLLL